MVVDVQTFGKGIDFLYTFNIPGSGGMERVGEVIFTSPVEELRQFHGFKITCHQCGSPTAYHP